MARTLLSPRTRFCCRPRVLAPLTALLVALLSWAAQPARAQQGPPPFDLGEGLFGGPYFGSGAGLQITYNGPGPTPLPVTVTAPPAPFFLTAPGGGDFAPGTYLLQPGQTLSIGFAFRPPAGGGGRRPRLRYDGEFQISRFSLTTVYRLTGMGIRAGLPRPQPGQLSAHDWSGDYEVSDDDGLVLRDVRFQTRYMAARMSVPYFALERDGGFRVDRAQLRPLGGDPQARSRLVGFRRETDARRTVVEAEYAVDWIPRESDACLLITQRYEFYRLDPDEAVEPSRFAGIFGGPPLQGVRYRPTVKYEYFPELSPNPGDRLRRIEFPLRHHYRVDGIHQNSLLAISDSDNPLQGFYSVWNDENPQLHEGNIAAIVKGQKGFIDNWHQSWEYAPEEPAPPPGCPECVHIHWRWGAFLNFPDPDVGNAPAAPIIRPGSDQDVEVALTRHHDDEVDPVRWKDLLLDSERTDLQDIVFWYAATGYMPTDEFFLHGGFFGSALQVRRTSASSLYFVGEARESLVVSNITPRPVQGSLVLDNLPPNVELLRATLRPGVLSFPVNLPIDRSNPRAPVINLTPGAVGLGEFHQFEPQDFAPVELVFRVPRTFGPPPRYPVSYTQRLRLQSPP